MLSQVFFPPPHLHPNPFARWTIQVPKKGNRLCWRTATRCTWIGKCSPEGPWQCLSKKFNEQKTGGFLRFISDWEKTIRKQGDSLEWGLYIEGDTQEADLCHCQQTSRLLKTLTTREVYLLTTVQNAFIPQRSKICLLQFNFLLW